MNEPIAISESKTISNHVIGVSCLCGTYNCNGEKCNPLAFDAVAHRNRVKPQIVERVVQVKVPTFSPEELWEEFLRTVASDAGIMKLGNFLGSVEKHKQLYLQAAKQLKEKNETSISSR